MTTIIKNRQAVADDYTLLTLAEGDAADTVALPAGPLLVPLAVWQARQAELQSRGTLVGVWLAAGEGPEAIAGDLAALPVVGVHFPKFVDGRGYSTARLLRERYAYQGEIRALGDVLHDQLFLMARCGFDAFALKEGKDVAKAVAAFETFKNPYQAAVDQPQPLFRRRAA
ncbi:DUF934 domain-containing protein [Azospira restricta]|uniref:DUF934 domain-containing protein n=1 Tax=Azospira restricta TaxID=404405 RepID=A0A974PX75_9RHOO|nr:DUF934 domain-containing protein [Azospira restricta]QRJ62986.1 DUF934 domain-containing protein [Azospira restricta]